MARLIMTGGRYMARGESHPDIKELERLCLGRLSRGLQPSDVSAIAGNFRGSMIAYEDVTDEMVEEFCLSALRAGELPDSISLECADCISANLYPFYDPTSDLRLSGYASLFVCVFALASVDRSFGPSFEAMISYPSVYLQLADSLTCVDDVTASACVAFVAEATRNGTGDMPILAQTVAAMWHTNAALRSARLSCSEAERLADGRSAQVGYVWKSEALVERLDRWREAVAASLVAADELRAAMGVVARQHSRGGVFGP
jgi:hypothetical protein